MAVSPGTDTCSALEHILDAIHDDILIADGSGVIRQLSKSFESVYGVSRDEIIGKTVYEMEARGIFRPSVTARVLETGQKTTMRQKNSIGRDIVVTAVPVRDESGAIIQVISFTRDVTDYMALQEQYHTLEKQVEKYSAEVMAMRGRMRGGESIVAESPAMEKIVDLSLKVAKYDANILITGESGVGKTMIARFIHDNSGREQGPFIEINCGAIPESLMESELFGYESGAFTGARRQGKPGLIEIADKGTLFLDEISEIPVNLQAKLLKVLQDKSFTRVGGTSPVRSDFRLVTASNKDLGGEVRAHRFREDLFYRINVIHMELPPIRERQEDLIALIRAFLGRFNDKFGEAKRLSPAAYRAMLDYKWPGNIRELENVIERLVITADGQEIGIEALPAGIAPGTAGAVASEADLLADAVRRLEKERILSAYARCGTSAGVARALGISQPTAYRKIRMYLSEGDA